MATVTGIVSFDAGGVARRLQFTTNRLCALEDHCGLSSLEVATELALAKTQPLGASKKTLRALFWAGIGDGDMTLAQAGDVIDQVGHKRAVEIAIEAFDAAHPDLADEEEQEGADRPRDAAAG